MKPHIFLPQLTKNRLAAFTVGVSGNLSDRIPGENRMKLFLNVLNASTNDSEI